MPQAWLLLLAAVPSVLAATHTIFTANRNAPAQAHMLTFDDETLSLKLVGTVPADTTHTWLSLSQDRTHVLASSPSTARTSVYAVNATSISLALSLSALPPASASPSTSSPSAIACTGKTSVFTLASPLLSPALVFTASYPAAAGQHGCGALLPVNNTSSLPSAPGTAVLGVAARATWQYAEGSGIHGMAVHLKAAPTTTMEGGGGAGAGRREMTLYSADLGTDSLWTHRVLVDSGSTAVAAAAAAGGGGAVEVTELARTAMANATEDGRQMHPRHLAVHPDGKVLYAIMEADNSLVAFELDGEGGVPIVPAGGMRDVWSLLPDGATPSQFWSADLTLSQPPSRYLWATARARRQQSSRPAVGYMSVFELDPRTGRILRRLPGSPVPTSTRAGQGSTSNAITAAPWNDEFAVLTDVPGGYVEVWRLVVGGGVAAGLSRGPVARVEVGDGCCANAVWFD